VRVSRVAAEEARFPDCPQVSVPFDSPSLVAVVGIVVLEVVLEVVVGLAVFG
jgi:hypothetical protein